MTEAEVLQLINDFIVANGNNEITADVLRPILEEMVKQPNVNIGDLTQLNTAYNDNLVNAINEVNNKIDEFGAGFVSVYQGYDNPNTTPPPSFNTADFYLEKMLDNTPIQLWQFNGIEWVTLLYSDVTLQIATDNGNSTDNPIVVQGIEIKSINGGIQIGDENTGANNTGDYQIASGVGAGYNNTHDNVIQFNTSTSGTAAATADKQIVFQTGDYPIRFDGDVSTETLRHFAAVPEAKEVVAINGITADGNGDVGVGIQEVLDYGSVGASPTDVVVSKIDGSSDITGVLRINDAGAFLENGLANSFIGATNDDGLFLASVDDIQINGIAARYAADYDASMTTDRHIPDIGKVKELLSEEIVNKADLVSGVVPSYQLPSYVDDIIDVANYAALPVTGETGKIYVTIDDNKQFRWTGSAYIQITNGLIGSTSDVPEGTNLYFTAARVLATVLTGISFATGTDVTAADSILVAIGKLQARITSILSSITTINSALSEKARTEYWFPHTGSLTLADAQHLTIMKMMNSSVDVITVPSGLRADFQVKGFQMTANQVMFTADSGVVIRKSATVNAATNEQYAAFGLVRMGYDGSDELYVLYGNLEII